MTTADDHAHPTACARRWRLGFDEAISSIDLRSRTDRLLSALAGGLEARGARLIGHIKGLIDAGENGHFVFSLTSFEEAARFKGEMKGGVADAVLTINVIAYGIEEKTVEEMLEEAFIRCFGEERSREPGGEGRAQ
jgi:hypothetical protein